MPSQEIWREKFFADLHELQNIFRKAHPAIDDKDFPRFKEWLELNDSYWALWKIDSEASYHWALRHFVNGLQEPHTWINHNKPTVVLGWPGFFIQFKNNQFVVKHEESNSSENSHRNIPDEGSVLVSCENTTPRELLDRNTIPYHRSAGTNAYATNSNLAPYLFIKTDNPFVSWPSSCLFIKPDSQEISYSIEWRTLNDKNKESLYALLDGPDHHRTYGIYEMDDSKAYWINMHSFSIDSENTEKEIQDVIQTIQNLKNTNSFKENSYFVFDLRGNSGGSPSDALKIMGIIFGTNDPYGSEILGRLESVKSTSTGYAYKASFYALERFETLLQQNDFEGYKEIINKIKKAIEDQQIYYDVIENNANQALASKPFMIGNQSSSTPDIYVLIDRHCFSACLIFADYMKNYPKVHFLGVPSGYDQPYMPIGIIFNRLRGYNESIIPKHFLEIEDMSKEDILNEIIKLRAK